jgi:methyl-accepting chemotaxis protein
MALPSLTVRNKMLIPAGAAVLSTFLATGVTLGLSERAASELQRVQAKVFPTYQFYGYLRDALKEDHLLLLNVGDSEDFTRIDAPDDLRASVGEHIQKDGAAVMTPEAAEKLRAEFEAFYDADRAVATMRIQNEIRKKKILAQAAGETKLIDLMQTPAGRAQNAALSEVETRYGAFYDRLSDLAKGSSEALVAALEEAKAKQRQGIWIGVAILLVSASLSFVLSFWLSSRTARPLHALSEVALRIADGDLTQEIHAESDDEIGVLARSFQRMSRRLREIVGTLKTTSSELAISAERLSDHTRAQSALLERQASGVAETSTTTRELEQTSSVAASRAASVLEVAKRAAEMSEQGRAAAERSAEELRRIQGSVDSIVSQSTGLLEQTRQVGDIVETVKDLATQSHVLSLNASIEAARAGEAGKSFAVVAQEVRALAEQSGQSAGRIARMVQDILSAVQSTRETTEKGSAGMSGSLDQIRASGDSLRQIGDIVREQSDAALHIASAVQQQSTGIGQIALAMRDLDKGMEETIGRIRSLELSAQQVAETATRISGIAAEFTV